MSQGPRWTDMTIREIRWRNIRYLRQKFGPKNKDFADALGISESYASQISSEEYPPITNVGDPKARKIEAHLNLPAGWLDREHPETTDGKQPLKPGEIDEVLAAKCVAAIMEALEKGNLDMPPPRIFGAALITTYSASQSAGQLIDPLPILRLAIMAGTHDS